MKSRLAAALGVSSFLLLTGASGRGRSGPDPEARQHPAAQGEPGDDDPDDPRVNVQGGALQAIRDDPRWAVHTNVVNHHRKLSRVHVMAMAGMTDPPSTGSISITLFKDATPHS